MLQWPSSSMSMSMMHVPVHACAAFPCPCYMPMSLLHVHVHAVCPCPCCMFTPSFCCMPMLMLYAYAHAACQWSMSWTTKNAAFCKGYKNRAPPATPSSLMAKIMEVVAILPRAPVAKVRKQFRY